MGMNEVQLLWKETITKTNSAEKRVTYPKSRLNFVRAKTSIRESRQMMVINVERETIAHIRAQ